jgi:hypothetical protein
MHAIDALDSAGVHVADAAAAWPFSYATFLLARSAAGSVTSTGQGFFFADYYDADGLAKVHSSLNHSLGELEYLLAIYARTGNPELLNTALSIKAAVDETGRAWIAPSGDLWYERDLDGTFNGTDYVTVTYLDLLQTQDLLRDLQGSADPVIAELIESKAHWLGIGDDPAGHSVRRRLLDAPAQAGTRQETLR